MLTVKTDPRGVRFAWVNGKWVRLDEYRYLGKVKVLNRLERHNLRIEEQEGTEE
jgi:hypothetical protein